MVATADTAVARVGIEFGLHEESSPKTGWDTMFRHESTLFTVLFLACLEGPMAQGAEPATARALIAAPRLLMIAHRGDSRRAPENTLPAFASAVRAAADLVELDYHHTADGIPVVVHDEHLDRTTNAVTVFGSKKIAVASRRWAVLGSLDAGTWFRPEFAGTRLPTLEAALDVIQRGSTTLIERKSGDATTCVACSAGSSCWSGSSSSRSIGDFSRTATGRRPTWCWEPWVARN